MSEGVLF